jgi:broad specificity phosphatase PhoE
MELICVRHGRTAWNAARRFQGQTDIPLDDEGLAQAQALAAHLRGERFDFALASDLNRARTTASSSCRSFVKCISVCGRG